MVKIKKELRDALVGGLALGVCIGAIVVTTIVYPPGTETPLWVYAAMWTVVPAGSVIGGQWIGRRLYGKTIAESVNAILKIHGQRIDFVQQIQLAHQKDIKMLRDVMVKTWAEIRAENDALERTLHSAEKSIHEEMCTNSACDSEFHK